MKVMRLRASVLSYDVPLTGSIMAISMCGPRPVVRPLLEQTFSEPIDEAPDIDRRYS